MKLLESATARETIAADITLYRGIGEPAAEQWRRRGLRVGQKITDPGFMSTTADPVVANLFADVPPDGLVLKISVPKGSFALNVAPYSQYPGDREYLMPRNTTIRVLGYEAATRTIMAEVVKDD